MPRPKFRGKATKQSCRKYVSKRISHHFHKGRALEQSVAIALSEGRKERCGKYIGRKKK
jgi:hypothetical protein